MEIQEHVILAPYTTFHIGGPAEYFTIVRTKDELLEALRYVAKHSMPYFVLGSGANILISDKGVKGLVIKNEAKEMHVVDTRLIAESGATIENAIKVSLMHGLSGLEHFAGIPSTVGGALWQNLHFLSPDRSKAVYIGDIVESAEIVHEGGEVETVSRNYFAFGYDTSILHTKKDIVLSASFTLLPRGKNEIQETIDSNIAWRQEKHPEEALWSSAGSVFRRIEEHGAGRLIEQVGLKGYQIGGAKISEKHANFILNTKDASAKDVRALIDLVIKKVHDTLDLTMVPEISFIGEF